jgi:hypothetical protein
MIVARAVLLNCNESKDNPEEREKCEVDHKGQNELKYHEQIFYTLTCTVPGFRVRNNSTHIIT